MYYRNIIVMELKFYKLAGDFTVLVSGYLQDIFCIKSRNTSEEQEKTCLSHKTQRRIISIIARIMQVCVRIKNNCLNTEDLVRIFLRNDIECQTQCSLVRTYSEDTIKHLVTREQAFWMKA